MSITLDTPEQIGMWVLLSRRHQIQLHLKGLTVKGLAAALKREFPGQGRYVKDFIVPVEFAISQAGGEVDYSLVNLHILEKTKSPGVFQDLGIHAGPIDLAPNSYLAQMQAAGRLEVVLTTQAPREPNGELYAGA